MTQDQAYYAETHEPTVEPDIYRDEPEPTTARRPLDARDMVAIFASLVRWAGSDQARLAIVGILVGMEERSQGQIARDHRISETRISRALTAGRDFMAQARKAQNKVSKGFADD